MDIDFTGEIVSDEWADIYRYYGLACVSPKDVIMPLRQANGEDVTLLINSPGGSLIAGYQIYCELMRYTGKTMALIQSYAASAATVAAMGCKKIHCYPVSLICAHNPSMATEGDYQEHERSIDFLTTAKESIMASYMGRVKISEEELSALMDEDKYITAQKALEIGLVDKIIETPSAEKKSLDLSKLANSRSAFYLTDTMRNLYQEHKLQEQQIKMAFELKKR